MFVPTHILHLKAVDFLWAKKGLKQNFGTSWDVAFAEECSYALGNEGISTLNPQMCFLR